MKGGARRAIIISLVVVCAVLAVLALWLGFGERWIEAAVLAGAGGALEGMPDERVALFLRDAKALASGSGRKSSSGYRFEGPGTDLSLYWQAGNHVHLTLSNGGLDFSGK